MFTLTIESTYKFIATAFALAYTKLKYVHIHILSFFPNFSCVQILLSYKHILGLLHLPGGSGRTPLMIAAENGHLE